MTTDQPYSPPQTYLPPPDRVSVRARPARLHTVFHIVEIALLAVLVTFAVLATVKYVQFTNALRDFGNQLDTSFSTDAPTDPGLPTCEPGQVFGCKDPGD